MQGGTSPLLSVHHCSIRGGVRVQEVGTGALRELGFSRVSPPWFRGGWGLRAWGCTSVLVSLFPSALASVRRWVRPEGLVLH